MPKLRVELSWSLLSSLWTSGSSCDSRSNSGSGSLIAKGGGDTSHGGNGGASTYGGGNGGASAYGGGSDGGVTTDGIGSGSGGADMDSVGSGAGLILAGDDGCFTNSRQLDNGGMASCRITDVSIGLDMCCSCSGSAVDTSSITQISSSLVSKVARSASLTDGANTFGTPIRA